MTHTCLQLFFRDFSSQESRFTSSFGTHARSKHNGQTDLRILVTFSHIRQRSSQPSVKRVFSSQGSTYSLRHLGRKRSSVYIFAMDRSCFPLFPGRFLLIAAAKILFSSSFARLSFSASFSTEFPSDKARDGLSSAERNERRERDTRKKGMAAGNLSRQEDGRGKEVAETSMVLRKKFSPRSPTRATG